MSLVATLPAIIGVEAGAAPPTFSILPALILVPLQPRRHCAPACLAWRLRSPAPL